MLYTEFHSPTMPGTCQIVCVRVVGGWLKPIIVLSLAQAEQFGWAGSTYPSIPRSVQGGQQGDGPGWPPWNETTIIKS